MVSFVICFSNGPPLPRTKGKGHGLAWLTSLGFGRVRYAAKAEVTRSFIFKPSIAALALTFLKSGSGISNVVFIYHIAIKPASQQDPVFRLIGAIAPAVLRNG